MDDEPRCPFCLETRLIKKVSHPLWTQLTMWFCQVCARTWVVPNASVH